MQADAPLARTTRSAIVLIALLQGLALYAVQELAAHWPALDIGWRYCGYAWVLTVPTAVALTVVDLKDRRLWLHAGLASLLVLALAAWAGWNLRGASGLSSAPLLVPLSICLAVTAFVVLPWWQFRLQHGRWNATYDALFERAWQNGLTLLLAAAFTGLTWMLLWLWAALFRLLGIGFFQTLFSEPAFVALATGALLGFGLLIARTQHRAMQITRQVLFAVCRGLLPLLALIAVLFVLALPFTGLSPLWNTPSAASLLLSVAILLVVFTNAVYQHEGNAPPYPAWLRRFVQASLLALPVYAGLAVYALGLRISQHGMSVHRFWGLAATLLVCGYAVGYALAALRRRGRWLQLLEPVNRGMCWTVVAVAVLGCSPLVDPIRLTLASQIPRLLAQPERIQWDEANLLRFELGIRGVRALHELQESPQVVAHPTASSIVAEALARPTRHRWQTDQEKPARTLQVLRSHIVPAAGSAPPAQDWWDALLAGHLDASNCDTDDEGCVVVRRDFDGDGHDDVLLCKTSSYLAPDCALHAQRDGQWRRVGTLTFPTRSRTAGQDLTAALRSGALEVHRPRWPEMALDGKLGRIMLEDDESREEAATP